MEQRQARASSRGSSHLHVSSIPFSEIPGQSKLFLQYQQDPASLSKYYPNAPRSLDDIAAFASKVVASFETDRSALTDILSGLPANVTAGKATLSNIATLRDPDAVAVVTGQQAGLFTGPLYTIYKALTAIRVASDLQAKGVKAVPIFWTASEDHDFEEVSNAWALGRGGLRDVRYDGERPSSVPVGNVVLDGSVRETVNAFSDALAGSEFAGEVGRMLTGIWASGRTFSDAFSDTVASLLGRFGLVFVDPMNEGLKRLAAPIYRRAIDNSDLIVGRIVERSGELARDGFHAQVKVENDYFPLFWHDERGQRTSLRKISEGVYRSSAARRDLTLDELRKTADEDPSRLSPGVMLRPIAQDYLLPTVCYLGGGAEISYFAQNSVAYETLVRPVTPIRHRQSFTIVGPRQARNMTKLGLEFTQLFDGRENVGQAMAAKSFPPGASELFSRVDDDINLQLHKLDETLLQIDPTLSDDLAKRRRKINYHIAASRQKAMIASARKSGVIGEQLDDLFAALWPNGALQERSVNVFSFIARFGPGFIDDVYASIDIDDRGHRIIEVR